MGCKLNFTGTLDNCSRTKRLCLRICVPNGRDCLGRSSEVLLYDLTSTYFEVDPPFAEGDKRRFGYSRESAQIACRW